MQRIQEHEGLFEVLEPRLLLTAFVVDTLADTHDANPGDGMAVDVNGDVSLRAAIEEANTISDNVDITFDTGLFSGGAATILLGGNELSVTDSLTITGPGADLLTIDGGGLSRVFNITQWTTIEGITISGGTTADQGGGFYVNASGLHLIDSVVSNNTVTGGSSTYFGGAGIYNNEGVVALTNSTVVDNVADVVANHGGGGGIHNYKGTLTLTDSTVSGNSTISKGGGIFSYYGDITIDSGEISGNTSTASGGNTGGGGIYSQGVSLSLTDVAVLGNNASNYGGGMFVNKGTVTINGGSIADNSSFVAGGMNNLEGHVTLTGVTVSGNRASSMAGGIRHDDATTLLLDSTVRGNSAIGNGGGIHSLDGSLLVERSMISGNRAGDEGGGFWGEGAFINSVVVGNYAYQRGGGLYSEKPILLTNSTVVSNHADFSTYGISIDSRYGQVTLNNSMVALHGGEEISGDYDGQNNLIGINPGFLRLPDDGGDGWGDDPTTPGVDESANDDFGDLHLASSSIAIDQGNNALAVDFSGNPLLTDFSGNDRFYNGTVDIGAYENQDEVGDVEDASMVVTTSVDVVDFSDGLISLREALTYNIVLTGEDTITFAPELTGQTITLTSGALYCTGQVVIDASMIGGITIDGNDASKVFYLDTDWAPVELKHLTVQGGHSIDHGGGIYNVGGDLTLTECTIEDNHADNRGGGIYNIGGALILTNSHVLNNTADYTGGGIYNEDQALTINGGTVSGNNLHGIWHKNGNLYLNGLSITDNTGSGLTSASSLVQIIDSVISGNHSINDGGGIGIWWGSLDMSGCEVSHNSSRHGGGGIDFTGSLLTMVNCEVIGNVTVDGNGGGVNASGDLKLSNSIMVGNVASHYGGAISANKPILTITNSSIAGNSAASGGGVYYSNPAIADINNSIIALNEATDFSDISGSYAGESNLVGVDPGFVHNPNSGNDGIWGTVDDDPGDLHLQEPSLAINTGNNDLTLDPYGQELTVDLDNWSRVFDGNVDIGAYEYPNSLTGQAEGPSTFVTTADDVVDAFDGWISLREALLYTGLHQLDTPITFSNALGGQTITLAQSELLIDRTMVIDGSSAGGITINGDGNSRIFNISAAGQSIELKSLTLTGGQVSGDGGGIYNNGGLLTLTGVTVQANSATGNGGGIYNNGGLLTLTDSNVEGNSAENGGGIYNTAGDIYLTASTIADNLGNVSGGGIYSDGSLTEGMIESVNSKLIGNRAALDGGGIYLDQTEVTLINNILSINSAGSNGGGLYLTSENGGVLYNCTISGNSATNGGGVYNLSDTSSFYNTIISLNHATGVMSDIFGDLNGAGNLVVTDPLFVMASSAGDDGVWGSADDQVGDLHLTEASVNAINGGVEVLSGDDRFLYDIEGNIRAINGRIDIGAYESSYDVDDPGGYPPTHGTTYIVNSLVDAITNDGLLTLVEAIEAANTNTAVTVDAPAGSSELPDLILFEPSLFESGAQTFSKYDLPDIIDDLILFGPGEDLFTFGTSLDITADAEVVEISGMVIYGGGIVNSSNDLTLNHITLTQCQGYTGTAIINHGNLVVTNSTIVDNISSEWGNPWYGPPPLYAIFNNGGEMSIIESTIANNDGGGILNSSGDVRVIDSVLIDGEGIVNEGSSITIVEGSIIKQNDGSAIINRSGTTTVVDSELTGNERGLYVSGGYAMVSNSVIVGNDCPSNGGGILVDVDGAVLVTNSTITHNVAEDDGGGIHVVAGGVLTVNNSIVWNNQDSGGTSEIVGSYTGTANLIGGDPLFVRNPSAGSDGEWGTTDDDYGDLKLTETSSAIDQGDNSLAIGLLGRPLKADIAGMERIANGTVDMGAYEYGSVPYVEDPNGGGDPSDTAVHYVVNSLLDVVADDGLVTLREAMLAANGNTAVTADVVAGSDIEVDQVSFDPALFTGGAVSILLLHGNMAITESLDIIGPTGEGLLTIDAQELSQLFAITGSDTTVNISDLTLSNGLGANGGAISTTGSVLTLTNVILTNSATIDGGYGGGVYVSGGELIATNSSFTNNTAHHGGGIYVLNGEVSLMDSLVNGNDAVIHQTSTYVEEEGQGGGIFSVDSNLSLAGSTVSGNYAALGGNWFGFNPYPGLGGGIYSEGGQLTVSDSQVSHNDANLGGGIYVNGSAEIHGSVINGNETFLSYDAGGRGGGIYAAGTLIIDNTDIHGNSGEYDGGGIYFVSGQLTMSNSKLRSNGANSGSGLYGFGTMAISNSEIIQNRAYFTQGITNAAGIYNRGNLTMTNVVVAANVSEEISGGIYNSGTLTLIHCTVAGNGVINDFGEYLNVVGGIKNTGTLHMTNTIVSQNVNGDLEGTLATDINNLIGVDPWFVENPIIEGVWGLKSVGDLHLQPGSPAIDAGLGDASLPATDIEGNARHDDPDVVDTGSGNPTYVDIGAYEAQYPIADADFNDDGIVGLLDLDILGANWGMDSGATNADGDANGDGAVGLLDLDCLGALWATSSAMRETTEDSVALWWMMDSDDAGYEAVAEVPTLLLDEEEEVVTLF